MRSNYKPIGDYIQLVDERNKELKVSLLLGLSISKEFIPSVANIVGTNMRNYKIIRKNQFACSTMQVRRDRKMPVALLTDFEEAIISQAYPVFEISDESQLLPEYLMMWFSREEFDRHAEFLAVGGVRGTLEWEDFLAMELPIPSIEKQQEIVTEYNVVKDRIALNEQLNQKLEETAQALYKHWFVGDNRDLKLKELIEFNPKHSIPKGEKTIYVEMADVQENSMNIINHIERRYKSGTKFKLHDTLLARITPCLENGKTAFVNNIPKNEIAFGSTEFIVMRFKETVSPFWIYCLAKDEHFRSYAISSMVGSSGRQRVHSDYLKEYKISKNKIENMQLFHKHCEPLFSNIKNNANQYKVLKKLETIVLSKMAKVEEEKELV